MKIGFLGNANNYPFMLARAIKSLGHDVVFVVDSITPLNRPENRYQEIALPYPSWVVDCSPLDLWQYPNEPPETEKVIQILKECDALVLNEFGLALWDRIHKPAFALLTGTDLEILADQQYSDFCYPGRESVLVFLKKLFAPKPTRSNREHLESLIEKQRCAIRNAAGVNYFAEGMLINGDRLLAELGVFGERRTFFMMGDVERYDYSQYPDNQTLRLFNVSRIQWKKPRQHFICELDYKGTDVLIRGLGMFVRENNTPINIVLVKKGIDLEETYKLIAEERLSEKITWLETLDQISLYDEYKKADVVSDHFGKGSIGMGALDAMATGRPVIANCSPEIFGEALGESSPICHAAAPEEIRDQLVRLAADRELRLRIGKLSRQYVEKYFTPEHAARIVLKKLEHAC